ncbi:MAG: FAD-binding oxidoreductase [Alphaproteobacteria bacterium]|nr:FAD-binding oxidoreductase [Alphaproteobacteria bacterium]
MIPDPSLVDLDHLAHRSLTAHRLLLHSRRSHHSRKCERFCTLSDLDAYDEQIADDSKEHLAQLLLERLPGLEGAGFGRGWAGLYPESVDGRPFVGPFDGEPHLIAAAGAGGYGIQLAPAIGALAADWLTEGCALIVPAAAAFRPSATRTGLPMTSASSSAAQPFRTM